VKFELNRADILTSYTNEIDQLGRALKADKTMVIEVQGHTDTTGARALKADKTMVIEVQGHTDTTGARAYNMSLSSGRADAVRAYLIEKFDIKPERIVSRGYGPSRPMTSNDTRLGREQNRRVDIKVIR
jgi:outer membrane protein OmpA-like peptidoglycan-associated protein